MEVWGIWGRFPRQHGIDSTTQSGRVFVVPTVFCWLLKVMDKVREGLLEGLLWVGTGMFGKPGALETIADFSDQGRGTETEVSVCSLRNISAY